ncbi:hypothetical protein [Actinomadura montaniterrae]|uniref:Phage gp6-like head-tail connector protein n=1 Tax=Actinomadura montaniterrae TaxID=1803903 RepID=A0A6L3W5A9_9ACTN|nr:hypothetical protein [Actinomadura montaniterrae]KAB2384754.1 hypothetical protein F9B16_09915 [Actinomadura montaniterrae]
MAYATVAELTAFLDDHEPAGASRLLDRASRDIDRLLLCAVYDPDDADVQAALKAATLEQVAYQLEQGNANGIRHGMQAGVPTGSSAGAVDLSRGQSVGGNTSGLPLIGDQAFAVLQAARFSFQGPMPR